MKLIFGLVVWTSVGLYSNIDYCDRTGRKLPLHIAAGSMILGPITYPLLNKVCVYNCGGRE